MLNKIIELLPECDVDTATITEETSLAGDLGMSSMDYFMLINNIEDEFGIQVTEDDVTNILTIGDIIECIQKKLD